MPAQLIALTEGQRILIDKPILLLGRDQECDIQFDSRKISRRHCCIAQVSDQLIIRDLGSTNGIRINGVRVLEGYLNSGDEVAIGNYRYEVRWDSNPPAPKNGGAKKASGPEASKGSSNRAVVDRSLESYDQPVALVDPTDGSRLMAEPGKAPPAPDPTAPVEAVPAPAAEPLAEGELPDQIRLTPTSDDERPLFPPRLPPWLK